MNRLTSFLCLLTLAWTSCDLFQPVGPDPSEKFIKLFGGRGEQSSAALHLFGDSLYYILGTSTSFTDDDRPASYLILADRAGNRIWQRTLASSTAEEAIDMLLLDDALLVLSRLSANAGERVLVRKLDLDGALLWERVLPAQNPAAHYWPSDLVAVPNDGTSFLIIGSERTSTTSRIYAVEMDTAQQVTWEKTYNLIDRKSEQGVAGHIHNGNLLILGASTSLQDITRPILIEADRNSIGEELQSQICFQAETSLPSDLPAYGLTALTGDDFMVLTQLDGVAAFMPVSVRTQDRITPTLPLTTGLTLTPRVLQRTPEGDLLLLGHDDTYLQLMRYDADAQGIWDAPRAYGYASPLNRATALAQHTDGSLALLGTLDFLENTMIGLLKTSPDGLQ